MAHDLTVVLDDEPGALAGLGEALGDAGVNLSGASARVSGGRGTIHLLVEEDPAAARQALAEAGIDISGEREVVVVDADDEPGALGDVARAVAAAGVNIELMYVASGTRLVFGVDDLGAARQALAA